MRTARIKFLAITLAVSICITGGLAYAATVLKEKGSQHKTSPAFAPDQVIVAFKPGTPAEAKKMAHAQAGGRVIRTFRGISAVLVGIPSNKMIDKMAVYKHNPNVRYAEPNHYRTLTVPSEGTDPSVCSGNYFDEQWYLHNTGQSFLYDLYTGLPCALTGTEDADIDWLEAYEAEMGSSAIKIATVDSGVDWNHPDLANKIVETWAAPGVISAGEGPEDIIGHGTHVAGIAAADTNNGVGIAGVGSDTSIGSLKVCTCTDIYCIEHTCADSDIIDAISHAVDNDYHIINMSFGGPELGNGIQEALDLAYAAGLILVAGAGNNYQLNPPNHFYPADCEGVISVAATDHFDNIASFSNFGPGVDVAAPGTSILSTYPAAGCGVPDCYTWMDGTSMATPVVAGAAALVLSSIAGPDPDLSPSLRDAVINAILNNTDHTGALGQNMLAWTQHGRLNLNRALEGGGPTSGDELAVDFGPNGLWHYDGSSWSKISNWNPDDDLASWSGSLAVDFNGNGLWNYDGSSWSRMTTWDPEDDLAGWPGGLAVDFGSNGLWNNDGSSWRKLSNWNPSVMTGIADGLVVDFDGNGIWKYDGSSWSRISNWNAENMSDCDLN